MGGVIMANKNDLDTAALISERGLFLTIYDIMDLLKVSRPVVDRMLKTGRLPAAKVNGHQYRVRTDDFVKWWDNEVKQEQKNILRGCLK